jgi:hypothetical protein
MYLPLCMFVSHTRVRGCGCLRAFVVLLFYLFRVQLFRLDFPVRFVLLLISEESSAADALEFFSAPCRFVSCFRSIPSAYISLAREFWPPGASPFALSPCFCRVPSRFVSGGTAKILLIFLPWSPACCGCVCVCVSCFLTILALLPCLVSIAMSHFGNSCLFAAKGKDEEHCQS